MRNILRKEMKLSASPLSYLFILFGLMFFLPGYPASALSPAPRCLRRRKGRSGISRPEQGRIFHGVSRSLSSLLFIRFQGRAEDIAPVQFVVGILVNLLVCGYYAFVFFSLASEGCFHYTALKNHAKKIYVQIPDREEE